MPKRTLGALVVVALIVLTGVTVSVLNLLQTSSSTSSAEPMPRPVDTPGATVPSASGECPLASVTRGSDLSTAPVTKWTLDGPLAAPQTSAGPATVTPDGFRICYSHSAEGALLAAANFVALGSNPRISEPQLAALVASGPAKDKMASSKATRTAPAQPEVSVQIAGYRVVSYSPSEAAIDIALQSSRGATVSQVFQLAWEDDGWRVRAADDGSSMLTPLRQLTNLTGFTSWRGA